MTTPKLHAVPVHPDAHSNMMGPVGEWPDVWVPPAIYAVGFVSVELVWVFRRAVWVCRFKVVEPGPCFGAEIPRYIAKPTGPLSRSSSLWQDAAAVLGGQPPRNVTPKVLYSGKVLTAKAATVIRSARGDRLPPTCWRSRIERIVGVEAGA